MFLKEPPELPQFLFLVVKNFKIMKTMI